MQDLYDMIFKRKSFHLFRDIGNEKLTEEELDSIRLFFDEVVPLNKDIKVKFVIDKGHNTCMRGQEYCILMYSEVKDNYLQNIGYIGEQIDLFLVSKNIASLWYGIGWAKEKRCDGLDYVIMIAMKKADSPLKFRKDMFASKRKPLEEIWQGNSHLDIANIVRFAPSACNTQPWLVKSSSNQIDVYRYKGGKHGIMPKNKVDFYNQIDLGIFLLFLELCLKHNNIKYERNLFIEDGVDKVEILNATYQIKEE